MILLFNKPYGVLTKFTDSEKDRPTLADYIHIPRIYAAGRLDMDSEGLLILTDQGKVNHRLTDPKKKAYKTYLVQVEGIVDQTAQKFLTRGVNLKDGKTLPAKVKMISEPDWVWDRHPPIRKRKTVPTSWIQISIKEGRNRQVRRMTASVGFPTLRLIRTQVDQYSLGNLSPGQYRILKQ